MEIRKVKKEVVKKLLNNSFEVENDDELMEILFENNIAIDVENEDKSKMKFGDRLADKITVIAGSWLFIAIFISFLIIWVLINVFFFDALDPYPFILLNLFLSCIAAIQAPIIMMSQNRAARKDSIRNQNDYKTDLKSEILLEELHLQMADILKNQRQILRLINTQEETEKKENTSK